MFAAIGARFRRGATHHVEGVGVSEIDFQCSHLQHAKRVRNGRVGVLFPDCVEGNNNNNNNNNSKAQNSVSRVWGCYHHSLSLDDECTTMMEESVLSDDIVGQQEEQDFCDREPRRETSQQGQGRSRFNWMQRWRKGDQSASKGTIKNGSFSDEDLIKKGKPAVASTSSFSKYASLPDLMNQEEASVDSTTVNSSPHSSVESDVAGINTMASHETAPAALDETWEYDQDASTIHAAQLVLEETTFTEAWQTNTATDADPSEEVVEFFEDNGGIELSTHASQKGNDDSVTNVLVPRQVSFHAVDPSLSTPYTFVSHNPRSRGREKTSSSLENASGPETTSSHEILLLTDVGRTQEESFELVRPTSPRQNICQGSDSIPTQSKSLPLRKRNPKGKQAFKWLSRLRSTARHGNTSYREFTRDDTGEKKDPEASKDNAVSPASKVQDGAAADDNSLKDESIFEVHFPQEPFTRMVSGLTFEEASFQQDQSDQFAIEDSIECKLDGTKVKQVNQRKPCIPSKESVALGPSSLEEESEYSLEILSTSTLEDREIERLISWEIQEYLEDLVVNEQ